MVVDLKEILDLCDGFEWDGGNSTKNWLKHKVSWNLKKAADVSRKMRRSYFEKIDFTVDNGSK